MSYITIKEISALKDEVFLRPNDATVMEKCAKLASDYADGFREIEDSRRAKSALWRLFNAMPRTKGKTAAIRRMQKQYPDMFADKTVSRGNAHMTAYVSLKPETTKVVVKLYAKNLVNGMKSVRQYDFTKIKGADRLCVFTYKQQDTYWVEEYDKSGKLVANTIRRPDYNRVRIVDPKANGGR